MHDEPEGQATPGGLSELVAGLEPSRGPPRVAGVVLCAISPSVANALKVAATIVNSVSAEDRRRRTGQRIAVIASRPAEIDAIEIRYQDLRDSV